MSLPVIEDEFEDVLGKAMRGQGLSTRELATRAGISPKKCEKLLSGKFDASAACLAAKALNLNADCLVQLAKKPAKPEVQLPEGIRLHNTPFPVPGYAAMTVNSYSIMPPGSSGGGVFIDAGADFESVLKDVDDADYSKWVLFLTHTHSDHVTHFSKLSRKIAQAYAPADEPYMDALPIRSGDIIETGRWQLTAIGTPGHSPGGMSYLLEGPSPPIVFVGDALFCYSVGKVNTGYEAALSVIEDNLLSLPGETLVCPGHGPPTTVAFERQYNPFFA